GCGSANPEIYSAKQIIEGAWHLDEHRGADVWGDGVHGRRKENLKWGGQVSPLERKGKAYVVHTGGCSADSLAARTRKQLYDGWLYSYPARGSSGDGAGPADPGQESFVTIRGPAIALRLGVF